MEPRLTRERAYLVVVSHCGRAALSDDSLEEIRRLAETAGAEVVGGTIQKIVRPHAATYVGSGKVEEIARRAAALGAHVVIFDVDLTPAQVRNLERRLERRVVDRTQLILHIFALHARTAQAKLQVELAQLEYLLPRLRRMWTHLGQQAGGLSATGQPGIGQRGPGEKQLEVDRRLARDRIVRLRRQLEAIGARRERHVSARVSERFSVALVGYTNAGKSTLLNALTGADALVEDRLFSTLDTRTRLWRLPDGLPVWLSDTVGFIRNLPHRLVASFHATLEEVAQADLLLHVVDASHSNRDGQVAAVCTVLEEIGCGSKPVLLVFNKIDQLEDPLELGVLRRCHPQAVAVSALGRVGLDVLGRRVQESLVGHLVDVRLEVPATEGRVLADIHERCVVVERQSVGGTVHLRVRAPRAVVSRLDPYRNGEW